MLPSKVLSSSLHYHQPKKLTIRTSAAALVDGVIIFQEKARIPKLIIANGTGKQQAKAVVEALEEWGLVEKVVIMAFDTTASNTMVHAPSQSINWKV